MFVSGVGAVSPIGIDCDSIYENLTHNRYLFKPEKRAIKNHGYGKLSSQVSDDDKETIRQHIFQKGNEGTSLPQATQYSIYATKMALEDAGINVAEIEDLRIAIILGNNESESEVFDTYLATKDETFPFYASYKIPEAIAKFYGLKNVRNLCIHNTCASSNLAMEIGLNLLRTDQCELAIVGGTDCFSQKVHAGFDSLFSISKQGSKPFSEGRDGITIGEGSSVLILERESFAAKRGFTTPYCEVVAVSSSNDAKSLTAPDVDGILLAYKKVLREGNIAFGDIDYVMSHGTGTNLNDSVEATVINVLANGGRNPEVCSIKGIVGHMMAVAGSFASVIICMIFRKGIIPGSPQCLPKDKECAIDIITDTKVDMECNIWSNHSFGFGGNNSIALFRRVI
ncbi:beta-ketoacyl synthase N-terminal-like domain-containing protein [Paenibacillus motobuensis]|uniref:beta-ketoacyl synthase N-terminal-like domain-containing protein n=1 Tax=Paenibacillus motobuensis TaxID=295324 RepID=UPI0031D94CEB